VLDLGGGPDLAPAAWSHDKARDAQLSPQDDIIKLEQLNV